MKPTPLIALLMAALAAPLLAQEPKPVPKDSMRVSISGCSKGYAFTAFRRANEEASSSSVPDGTHFRMNGPKKTMEEIKTRDGSMIEITGLVRRDDLRPSGVRIGGVRIGGGSSAGRGLSSSPLGGQIAIDVEGWRSVPGDCPR
jgi:hypothetical protein